MILAIASTKGGVSKTTLAVCLADHWSRAGLSVACIDTDPNRNLTGWLGADRVPGLVCSPVEEDRIATAAIEAAETADRVIIDVAGVATRGLIYAAGIADLVLIPCHPARGDVGEAARTAGFVREAAVVRRHAIPYVAILTAVNPRAAITPHARAELCALGLPVLEAVLPHRAAYAAAWFRQDSPLAEPPVAADIAAIVTALEQSYGTTEAA